MTMDEQSATQVSMVRTSAAAVAPRDGDLSRIRALRFQAPDFDLSTWRKMAELGWIGLALAEEEGGIGLGMSEAVALTEELGRALVPEPLIATSLTVRLLSAAGHEELLERVLTGERLVATAWADSADAMQPARQSEAPRRFVSMSGAADAYIFTEGVGTGLALRLVEATDVSIESELLQDGGAVSTVSASPNVGQIISDDVSGAFARAFDEAVLATAGYLLGAAERAFEMTVDYLKLRRQFDQPLAAFQALQHRAVDMKIQLALCRASVAGAATSMDLGADAHSRSAVVSRAKARAADTAMLVARESIQLHGAIGYTDEYDVGLFARKIMVTANQYGSAGAHRRRFASLSKGQV